MSIVAISRGTFSGGEAVAKSVANRLGYQCVSREVVLEAAWGYGVPAKDLATAMEKRPPLWERLAGVRNTHIVLVQDALCQYARGGKLVYHGYLGHLFLPGIAHVVRARVIADVDFRINAAMEQQKIERKEATAYIEKVDKERRQWTRFLFDVEWDDPQLYDIVLNVSRMSVDTASEMIVRLAERPEFQATRESATAMEDLALRSRASAVLVTDARTKSAVLTVTAEDGVVTVTGTTQSPALIDAVPEVVRLVDGVKDVRSSVRLLREGGGAGSAAR